MNEHALPTFYANILYELSIKPNDAERYLSNLQMVLKTIQEHPKLETVLYSPLIGHHEKQNIIKRLFGEELDPIVSAFLKKLLEMNRMNLLSRIVQKFSRRVRDEQGILDVKLVLAETADDRDKRALKTKISGAFGKQIDLYEELNRKIIGGMILMFSNNKMLDYSLKTRLNRLQESLERK